MRIQDILDEEGREALRMDGGFSVEDVVHLMMDTDKSALIVTEGERPTRILQRWMSFPVTQGSSQRIYLTSHLEMS